MTTIAAEAAPGKPGKPGPHGGEPRQGASPKDVRRMGWLDRMSLAFLDRPSLFAMVVLLALLMLPVAVWLDLRNLSNEALARQAGDLNAMISDIRAYYSANVVSRVTEAGGSAVPVHNYTDVKGGIPIPATLSIEMGSVIGGRTKALGYRFVSDYVFTGRASHHMDAFEANALATMRETRDPNASVTEITGGLLDRRIRMAVPVMMGPGCVSCHNSHPDSPKRDWKVGDVRGIQAISVAQPIAANAFSFKFLLTYLLLAGAAGLAFIVMQMRQARRFALLNGELEETNGFLAAVSMKISKYLSPQVYRSIFSGERDAVIATERKKLTIFFSDIKDFTVTTERLQPEELTGLLNEYFTEMSAIAHAHGATVDKFIGDAILAFFGDPETKGTREDALACVQMAIDMQRRLATLERQWRARGIEHPFRARMGINTGYCNVGNFGSADRMDYTIIGAEANLAARLESVAEPGGIVLSYETYALVKERFEARPLSPITLKGISREVVPYVVENVFDDSQEAPLPVIAAKTSSLDLKIDLSSMAAEEGAEIEAALQSALKAVRERRGGQAS